MKVKKADFFLLILIIVFLFGCEKSNTETQNACKSSNPVEDVIWLKALKSGMTNCYCEQSIITGTHNGETVFYIAMTDQLCDGISNPTFYDCLGNIVKSPTDDNYQEFREGVVIEQVMYRCKTTK